MNDESPYVLGEHVSACCTSDYVVLLDARANRYLGIGGPEARAVSGLVRNWPKMSSPSGCDIECPHEAPLVLADLLQRGILLSSDIQTQQRDIKTIPRGTSQIVDGYAEPSFRLRTSDIAAFARAVTAAWVLRRTLSIEGLARRTRKRRLKNAILGAPSTSVLRNEVAKFEYLVRLFFAHKDSCLFRALALQEFLAASGLHPSLVFGVDTNPFSAHCWLQHEELVLNDCPETVNNFTPILVI